MKTIDELYEERRELVLQGKELRDKKDPTEADLEKLQERLAEIEAVDTQVTLVQRTARLLSADAPPMAPGGNGTMLHPAQRDVEQSGLELRARLESEFGAMCCVAMGKPLPEEHRALNMTVGADGGYLVPPQHSTELFRLDGEDAIMRPGARVIPAGSPPDASIDFPQLIQGAQGAQGGVVVEWIEEGAAKPETEVKFGQFKLEPKELAAYIPVTDKLLRNAPASGAMIAELLREKMVEAEDEAFLSGNGTGKPLGVMSAAGRLTVARAGAGAIVYADATNMMARMLPQAMSQAIWVAHMSCFTTIAGLTDPAGRFVFGMGDVSKGIPHTLLGLPIRWTGATETLGTEGDLMLLNRKYYWIKDGSGPFIASSIHPLFTSNKTVIKCFQNVDGNGVMAAPLTLRDGTYQVSPFVFLTDAA